MSITLISSDKKPVIFENNLIEYSEYLKGLKKDTNIDFKEDILIKVKEYLSNYDTAIATPIPKILTKSNFSEDVGDWNAEYIQSMNFENVFHLTNAGNIFKLQHLHELACARIAFFMRENNSPDEVAKEFTIQCILTQDEVKEMGFDQE